MEFGRNEAFDQPELESLHPLHRKGALFDFLEGATQEMLTTDRYGDHLERSLHTTGHPRCAGDVVNQNQLSAGS
jgi:hypothetical protein